MVEPNGLNWKSFSLDVRDVSASFVRHIAEVLASHLFLVWFAKKLPSRMIMSCSTCAAEMPWSSDVVSASSNPSSPEKPLRVITFEQIERC